MSVSAAEAVASLSERLSRRSREDLDAEAEALRLLPSLAAALRAAGARRVVLFGSLATGLFHRQSDIDLAVEGLTEADLARLERVLTLSAGRPVELADLATVHPLLRERIRAVGRELA